MNYACSFVGHCLATKVCFFFKGELIAGCQRGVGNHRVRPMGLFITYLNVATVNLYQKIIYKFKMLSSHSKHGMSSSMYMYALIAYGRSRVSR